MTPREHWAAAPWYEKLGMTLFLGAHVVGLALIALLALLDLLRWLHRL